MADMDSLDSLLTAASLEEQKALMVRSIESMTSEQFKSQLAQLVMVQNFLDRASVPLGALIRYVIETRDLITEIKIAVGLCSDNALSVFLADYPKQLLSRAGDATEENSKLKALSNGEETLDEESFVGTVHKYREAILHGLSTGDYSPLRTLVRTVDSDLASLIDVLPHAGRSEERDPLTRVLANRAHVIWERNKFASWTDIAKQFYAELLLVKKPSSDERDMLVWFEGMSRNTWRKRLNEVHSKVYGPAKKSKRK